MNRQIDWDILSTALRTTKRHLKACDASDFAIQNLDVAIQTADKLKREEREEEQ